MNNKNSLGIVYNLIFAKHLLGRMYVLIRYRKFQKIYLILEENQILCVGKNAHLSLPSTYRRIQRKHVQYIRGLCRSIWCMSGLQCIVLICFCWPMHPFEPVFCRSILPRSVEQSQRIVLVEFFFCLPLLL